MMHRHYILNEDNIAVPVDLLTWARWFEENIDRRRMRRDVWPDGVVVSTVFLGLDHAFSPEMPRQIYETMVFSSDQHANACERYATWAQAMAGHDAMIRRIGRFSAHSVQEEE